MHNLHKKGLHDNPDYFHGVSLMNVISKTFMLVLTSRLTQWFDKHITDESQADFHSTIDNRFTLQSLAQKYLSKPDGRFYCLFF